MHSTKRLAESETEYYLWVPYAEKERAKQIGGYRWDAKQKCWAFRKSQEAYEAIVSEFGDELENQVAPRVAKPQPQPPELPAPPVTSREASAPPSGDSTQQESIALRHQVQELQNELRLQIALRERAESEAALARQQAVETHAKLIARESRPDVATLLTQVKNATGLVAELQAHNAELSEQLRAAQKAKVNFEKEAEEVQLQLMNGIRELEEQLKSKPAAKDMHKRLVNLAVKASGNDEPFAELVGGALVFHGLEVKIAAALSAALCARLKKPSPGSDLYEIIRAARDQGILTNEDSILADTIRRQRNTLAHQDLSKHEVTGRLILILYAAALLWPKLTNAANA